MKSSIESYRENLENMKKYLYRVIEERYRVQRKIEQMHKDIYLLEEQIKEAEKRGMDSFDNTKLLVKKSQKRG